MSVKCPKCQSFMRERESEFGKFYGCSRYPRCKGIQQISHGKDKAWKEQERERIWNECRPRLTLEQKRAREEWRAVLSKVMVNIGV